MKEKYKRISITIPEKLLNRFRKFCKDNDTNMSGKIARFIRQELQSKTERRSFRQ